MLTARQQAAVVATRLMQDLNDHPNLRDLERRRVRSMLVCYPGTLASGFSARFYDESDNYVDGLYLGNYVEPYAQKQPE